MIQKKINEIINLEKIEIELKKRWNIPYVWFTKQNDKLNKLTNFIYLSEFQEFEKIVKKIYDTFDKNDSNFNLLFNFALNRWYNFWSAKAVEQIFCSFLNTEQASECEIEKDFYINDMSFDHKTTIYPKNFFMPFEEAKKNKSQLIIWLYINQSEAKRRHFRNKIYLVLYDKNGEHWKLKAEIFLLKEKITEYMLNFNFNNLLKFFRQNDNIYFLENHNKINNITLLENIFFSDIIWIEKKEDNNEKNIIS